MNKKKIERRFIFICLAPAILLFTVFLVYPTFEVFRMSLYRWGGLSGNKVFVGFDNFKYLWNDSGFYQAFQNTLFLIVMVTIVTLVLAVFFANLLIREKFKGSNFFRVIFYIPNILSIVVIAGLLGDLIVREWTVR